MTETTFETLEGSVPVEEAPEPRLGLTERLIVGGSAASDLVVRTALASVISLSATPWALGGAARGERRRLAFYRDLVGARDAALTFPRPEREVEMHSAPLSPWSVRARGVKISTLWFESPYVAANPLLRDEYAGFRANGTAWAQHWYHDDGPRPTLCVIHGFGASPYLLNSAVFALPWLYSKGYDLLLYTMPFHGPRRAALAPMNGAGMFAFGPANFNEAMLHAVHDFRLFVDHLEASGVEQVGVTGVSLGGYLSAVLATVEERLRLVITNAAVTNMADLVRQWFPAGLGLAVASRLNGVPVAEIEEAVGVHSPLSYPSLLPTERLMIIGGLGDRLAPPEQSRALWEHWGQPRLHWYPGNHFIHVNRSHYLREMRGFMKGLGFTA